MKRILIVFLLVLLAGCQAETETIESFESDIWDEIVNKEFSNYDVWAGQGVYFYEEEGIRLCAYMKYGSGFPVVNMVIHEVEVTEENQLLLVDREVLLDPNQEEPVAHTSPISSLTIQFENNVLVIGDLEFYETEFSHYDYIIEILENIKEE